MSGNARRPSQNFAHALQELIKNTEIAPSVVGNIAHRLA
jgi:hypothetical protein